MAENLQSSTFNRFRTLSSAHNVRWLLFVCAVLVTAALACNVPSAGQATLAPPPTPASGPAGSTIITPTVTVVAPSTAPALLPTNTAAAATAEAPALSTPALLPTFTPIAGPTLAATLAPQPTAGVPAATATARPTATPRVQGPLRFTYDFNWRFAPDNPFLVIARVTLHAQGGSGVYTYYHDDIRQAGAIFEFNWVACRPKPGSLRVDSTDGQSVRQDYYQEAPCPTPTPVP
jgi:hypothetical protein